jgi:hypothetical protein
MGSFSLHIESSYSFLVFVRAGSGNGDVQLGLEPDQRDPAVLVDDLERERLGDRAAQKTVRLRLVPEENFPDDTTVGAHRFAIDEQSVFPNFVGPRPPCHPGPPLSSFRFVALFGASHIAH